MSGGTSDRHDDDDDDDLSIILVPVLVTHLQLLKACSERNKWLLKSVKAIYEVFSPLDSTSYYKSDTLETVR